MAYVTIDDLTSRLPQATILDLCHDPELGGEKKIDDPFVVENYTKAMEDATAKVETYILPVHDVPLDEPYPIRIIEVTTELTVYNLYKRRGYADNNPYINDYNDEISWLGKLSKGTVKVYFDPGTEEDKRTSCRVRSNADAVNNPSEIPDKF